MSLLQPSSQPLPPPVPVEVGERRCHRRRETHLDAWLWEVIGPDGQVAVGPPRRGRLGDISQSGARLWGAGHLRAGAVVRLLLRLPDCPPHRHLACWARVVRSDLSGHPSYGLRLIRVAPGGCARLRRFVG